MTSVSAEHLPPQRVCCRREVTYDRNQASAELSASKVTRSLSNRISWSTVSKAAERSRRTSMPVSPRSTASRRSERTWTIAVSVEYPHRKPDWVVDSRPFASMYVTSWRATKRSNLKWPTGSISVYGTTDYFHPDQTSSESEWRTSQEAKASFKD